VYVLLLLFLSGARVWILYRERPAETRAEDQIILGEEELIELSSRKGGETIEARQDRHGRWLLLD
jgi:hypothetical protein